ncbi:hypothetical protein N7462_005364 [Penicillium macrosclerotiorum]|uniref:uncharacterized protein n=1 Tax=Penicillium macrosclerotiorum TaxID=303699 RepID=UPI002546EF9F|nr:uncharacterized protein N7462_005364 [Penicillium macrosclerotiorum]KAJ5682199.1 hypothetical protein N7462_005364 [Penicillium macrosclerotiorum]
MKFLCLPGGFCTAKAFQTQLGPFCDALKSTGDASFFFTQGTNRVHLPQEYGGFFGPPPHYTFLEVDNPESIKFNLCDFPKRNTPEASMRSALDMANQPTFSSIRAALERLIDILDSEGDIEGIIGYSEGAKVAASLLMEEEKRRKATGRIPRLKYAIFVCGWPPMDTVTGAHLLIDDIADDEIINIPTCHVVGAADPFIDASMALYNMCDPDTADLFDHGGGHVVPRGKRAVDDLAVIVRGIIESITV